MNRNKMHICSGQQGRSAHILLAAVAAFAIGIMFYSYKNSQTIQATDLQKATSLQSNPRELPSFSLKSHLDTPFTKQNLIGHWSLVFFGFTNCPDVCPVTLNVIDQAIKNLNNYATIPRGIFISVDPHRDQPEKLKEYVQHFNSEMLGATGTKEEIDKLTQAFGAIYAIAENSSENYLVDHSAHIFVIAPNGKMIALFSMPHDAKVIAHDFKIISALHNKNS